LGGTDDSLLSEYMSGFFILDPLVARVWQKYGLRNSNFSSNHVALGVTMLFGDRDIISLFLTSLTYWVFNDVYMYHLQGLTASFQSFDDH
jgi:hypothetical protein